MTKKEAVIETDGKKYILREIDDRELSELLRNEYSSLYDRTIIIGEALARILLMTQELI